MDKNCAYFFCDVNVKPKLLSSNFQNKFDSDIDLTISIFTGDEKHSIPEMIIQNSKEMSIAYQYVYIIENVLRSHIENKGILLFGDEYLKKISVPRKITDKIEQRMENDEKNVWMSFDRDSHLNHLDLMDLYNLVENNWDLFRNDFPTKEWIKSKIAEINECRKLIAHNNNCIGPHSKEVLITNSKSILKQLGYLG
ncbi:Swt1 family HEPN domain-containing protein [Methanogenium sp. MK-MG]|uniref:Swt1 family HEPN domain-containing protein n=1 Tax=Methanogenium sp. MK-MG TaxID=2599926 RepID=UPI0013EDC3DD|nr:Swt1 family HEPN domain-containing protein [Methanogenium sp. MK-MG]KAF1077212.1 hypothetical protein MKMG_01338 [Methanogenium sp. MK-MG]